MPYQTQFHHHPTPPYLSTTTLPLNLLIILFSINPSFTSAQSTTSNDSYKGSPLPTTAIVIIAVVFGVGITVCYIRHFIACIRGYVFGVSHNGSGGGGVPRRRDTVRGLDPAVMDTFPTFSYSDVKHHLNAKTTPLECAICIYEFVDQDLLRLLPTCNHVFHPQCIAPWFSSHNTCPVCRANLEIQPDSQPLPESLSHVLQHQRSSTPDHQSNASDHDLHPPESHHHDGGDQSDVVLQVVGEAADYSINKSTQPSGGNRFQRSHSTGHSLVENFERFTLRLPIQVRNKLVNQNFIINNNNNIVNNNNNNNNNSRGNLLSGLSGSSLVSSPRVRYRAWSVSGSTALMSTKQDTWRFSMSPPYISRFGLSPEFAGCSSNSNSSSNSHSNSNILGIMRSPRSLFKSMKSPVAGKTQMNRVVRCDDIGERSSDKLWPYRTSQELGLQDH